MLARTLQQFRAVLSDSELSSLRIRIFGPVFLIACLGSLAFVWSRPAVYLGKARLQIEAPAAGARPLMEASPVTGRERGEGQPNAGHGSRQLDATILTEAQALTSVAVLDQALQQATLSRPGFARTIGSVEALQRSVSVEPVSGTNVIELRVEGNDRELLHQLLKSWIDAYQQSYYTARNRSAEAALGELQSMDQQLMQKLTDKRRELEQFRRKFDIVSLEREENQTMSQLKGLNAALNEARNREVNAEARLSALNEGVAAGRTPERPADKAVIAELERRAMDMREKIRDLEQVYTPQYLALDGRHKAMVASLARLEQQIERTRQSSAAQALQAAEEDFRGAQQTVFRLQKELAIRKQDIQNFTARFAEHRALANELRSLEEMSETRKQRLARLEIEIKGAGPKVNVLSPPSIPDRPEGPDYWRDSVIAVLASVALGLLAVWFIEFFRRSGVPQPEPVTQPIIQIGYSPGGVVDVTPTALGAPPPLQLPSGVTRLPRELSNQEVRALWEAASPDARLVIAAILGGLSLEELAGLSFEHVDFEAGRLQTSGPANRSIVLHEPFKRLLKERTAAQGGSPLLADAQGGLTSAADLESLIVCAACDAGLAYAADVNSEVLRHTYLAYLVRQGARLSDIGEVAGRMAPAVIREYGRLSPPGARLPLDQVDVVHPALRMQTDQPPMNADKRG